MMKSIILSVILVMTAGMQASEFEGTKESYDYKTAMKKVAAKFKGTEGVVLHMGDSITYANQNTRWARSFKWNKKGGYTAEHVDILKWSHADKDKSKLNGWHLASVDAAGGRSETASSGIKAGQYLQGGHRGLPAADVLIKRYNPQIAIVMLGTNDGKAKTPAEKTAASVDALLQKLLANGTIPVLSTIPPCTKFDAEVYNAPLRALAKKHQIPMIDLYKDMLALAGDNWKTQLISSDGIHLTHKLSGANPSKENLANCGYLLRCYLAVNKIGEVRANVLK